MRKNKIVEKLLAIILIFTLTFANFAFVTKSFATSVAETIFGDKSDTGSKNVKFEAYFGTEDDAMPSVISDVNNENLSINLKLDIQEKGYLKDGRIAILETEEGKGLNFKLKDELVLSDTVQSLEDNILELKRINSSSEIDISLPIEYKNEEYVNEEKLAKDAKVLFTGTYVDNDGDEKEVSKEVVLNVFWKDEREVNVETEATKYIDFGKGVILQTSVKVDNATEGNALPVKETEVTVEIPKLGTVSPSKITVVPNTTQGTNGKTAEDVIFDESNWQYNEEEGTLTIIAKNEKQLVKVNENEEEYLKEAEEEVKEEERYYSKSGIDEYLITYTFEDVSIPETTTVHAKAEAKLTTFSGVEKEEYKNIVTADKESEYTLEGQTGNIVSLNIENETNEVSKAYTYVNYNQNEKYETEYRSKTILNVSHKDIVEKMTIQDIENIYTDKSGSIIANPDMYYKQLTISRQNFDSILGEDGQITVSDLEGNVIVNFNKDYAVNEEGNLVFDFNERYTKLNIITTRPVSEGNLVINHVRAMKNTSLNKETFKNIESVGTQSVLKANYTYVDNEVEVATVESKTKLTDTTTKATLVMDRDNLSTLEVNKDVELRIELNNATDVSDVYGHSVFEIEMPEYIESLEITNANILYGEGLTVTSTEIIDRTIRIIVDGVQEGINSGVLTNGANIVLNTNIKMNLYTPAKSEVIKLKYANVEATNYSHDGYEELPVIYSAPTGLVTVNSITNYNDDGSVLTSVRQGMKEDKIAIYAGARTAKMEMIMINNHPNSISDMSILGRIPFKGVKNIATGDDLGATIDTKMVSGIVADERNGVAFTVYYSSNAEATKDINDMANGWTMNPENLETVKSYLIVPEDANYEMKSSEILRFAYDYEIPENLKHNEKLYGTFLTYYTNHSELATTEEVSAPDLVGLTTGNGPELNIEISNQNTKIKENEILKFTIKVENTGKELAKNVVVAIPNIPNAEYQSSEYKDDTVIEDKQNGNITFTKQELDIHQTIEIDVYFKVKILEDSEEVTNKMIKVLAQVTATDLDTVLHAESNEVEIEQAEIEVKEDWSYVIEPTFDIGQTYQVYLEITNLTDRTLNHVEVIRSVANELDIINAFYENETDELVEGNFNEDTRTLTWNIESIEAYDQIGITMEFRIARLADGVTKATIEDISKVKADNTDTYESNILKIYCGRPSLVVTQTTSNDNTYVKEGELIHYMFTIKNEGGAVARSVELKENIPDGLVVRKISCIQDGIVSTQNVSLTGEKVIDLSIDPGTEAIVNIEALAKSLEGVQEKTVTNTASLKATNIEEMTTNSITHIVEAREKSIAEEEESSIPNGTTANSNIVKTYKLTGNAWLDSNEDGMRDVNEETLTGISVKLVNSETGVIEKSVTTDSQGAYTFAGIKNGNYLVLFEYDTVKYTVTSYHKENVAPNVNSDAITTKIEQDGKTRNGAVTDVISINDGAVSNIDIGLILADTFDLKLEKAISKVTVQSNNKTTTDEYQNVSLAKTEIAAKHLTGSTVYVEYTLTVSNVGDVAGYAKKIVDYLPEGMTFNSGLAANANWYTGTDGNLYSTALADTELVSGQSQSIKLVLTKQMTEENTGITNNLAEIYEDYNIYGISDTNSTPANKAQGENDLGSADMVISVKTGEVFIYVSVIITSILLGSIVIFIAYNKIVLTKRKRGV